MTDLWPAKCTFSIRCISIVPLYSFHQLHAPPHNILRIHHSQILPSSKYVQEVCYNTSFSIMNRWFSPEPNSSKISVPTLVIVFSSRFLVSPSPSCPTTPSPTSSIVGSPLNQICPRYPLQHWLLFSLLNSFKFLSISIVFSPHLQHWSSFSPPDSSVSSSPHD